MQQNEKYIGKELKRIIFIFGFIIILETVISKKIIRNNTLNNYRMTETKQIDSLETICKKMKMVKDEYDQTENEYNYMALTYRMKLDEITSEYNKLLYQKTKLMDESKKMDKNKNSVLQKT